MTGSCNGICDRDSPPNVDSKAGNRRIRPEDGILWCTTCGRLIKTDNVPWCPCCHCRCRVRARAAPRRKKYEEDWIRVK